MATVHTSVEGARGCGYRKGGGLYLVSGELSEPCPLLPIPLHVCPTCGEGVRPARAWTWIKPDPLLGPKFHGSEKHDAVCPLGSDMAISKWMKHDEDPPVDRAGLIWIGVQHYKTAREFMDEAARMGVSRRITAVPRDFKIGETWVALGHAKAIPHIDIDSADEPTYEPGVVTFFRPTAIEYVVKGDEDDEELDALEARGFRLVKVVRAGEDRALNEEFDEEEVTV